MVTGSRKFQGEKPALYDLRRPTVVRPGIPKPAAVTPGQPPRRAEAS
jgi:hypothetical protein